MEHPPDIERSLMGRTSCVGDQVTHIMPCNTCLHGIEDVIAMVYLNSVHKKIKLFELKNAKTLFNVLLFALLSQREVLIKLCEGCRYDFQKPYKLRINSIHE